jgi:L-arabinokinase
VRPILQGSGHGLADVEMFVRDLGLREHPEPAARGFLDPRRELVVARAPGRLDLMGGIADYSGSLVLQWPLREATLAAAQRQTTPKVEIVSLGAEANGRSPSFGLPMEALCPGGRPLDYAAARALFAADPAQRWAAYAAGTLLVLMRENAVRFDGGVRLLIRSDVPEGKGVSSSAAFEVAVMQAVATAFDLRLEPRPLALLCQRVENLVVGAPCGVMDQMTAAVGRADELLALLCQPAELQGNVALPRDLEVWGLDSGVRHAVSGSDYTGVRIGAFMGARIIADILGLRVSTGSEGRVSIDDPVYGGYLARITPSIFETSLAPRLPASIAGRDFLTRYSGTTDPVTRVDPERTYAVRQPTAHPVYEHARVRTFAELLGTPPSDKRSELLGELMYESHASYSACGLGSDRTDLLVDLVREAGPARGFHGAKITGGGSGGTVAVLGRRGADIGSIADAFAARTSVRPHVFSGSSPGALAFGHLRLGPIP